MNCNHEKEENTHLCTLYYLIRVNIDIKLCVDFA